jgi:group I intron endonuclease
MTKVKCPHLPAAPGVYRIINRVNGKCYVGSASCVRGRWTRHKSALKQGKLSNAAFQEDFDKYGASAYECELLELCDKTALREREDFWIKELSAFGPDGLNGNRGRFGRTLSPEARQRIREAQLRIGVDPEERKKRSDRAKVLHAQGRFGVYSWPEETRARLPEMARTQHAAGKLGRKK